MSRFAAKRFVWILAFLLGSILVVSAAGWLLHFPLTRHLVSGLALGALVFLGLWLIWKGLQVFLWRVGRRLAFSYFLIGVLPIPMLVILILLNLYLLSGYFLGHLYRDAATSLQSELDNAASAQLEDFRLGRRPAGSAERIAYAFYLDGRRTGGASYLPEQWPQWLVDRHQTTGAERPLTSFVARADGSPTLAATATDGSHAVLAIFTDSIEVELARRSEVWVMLLRAEDPRKEGWVRLDWMGKEIVFQPLSSRPVDTDRDRFFGSPGGNEGRGTWWRRPFIWWGEVAGPFQNLQDGTALSDYLTASLNGTPATIVRNLTSGSAEINTAVWASLIAIGGVLLSLYFLAIVMAFFMIFGLSRAVNQLSRATDAVRRGEFSVRIPVRRRDQIGELHSSFNDMAAGLDRSVLAMAQKEVLEKELEIARELQESLLPADIPSSDRIEFATVFQPSSAIGGDYFDILRLDEDRLVIVIADVSGHGLPTGLRMAMLKAALVILVEEGKPPEEIFRRLSGMIRSQRERRLFVTATIAVVDLGRGTMQLTNAAHTPTYLLRRGEVQEFALTSHPLGALADRYDQQTVNLQEGDVVVWLSDGIVEATDAEGEPFGYERLERALRGPGLSAAAVRDRLLEAEEQFTGGRPGTDDKTLVAMRYSRSAPAGSDPAAE